MIASGNNYAETLFMLATEENALEEYMQSLQLVCDTFEQNGEYVKFLSAPSIPKAQRIAALGEAFGDKMHTNVLSLLQLLCEHRNIQSIYECAKEFERLKKWSENRVVATVKSAIELGEAQRKALTEKLQKMSGKKVVLECQVSPDVIGGLVVQMDGVLLDGSVKNNLNHIKEVIEK